MEYDVSRALSGAERRVQLALERSQGVVKAAAREPGVSRQALHERIRRKPYLRPSNMVLAKDREALAASALFLQVCLDAGELWAIKKVLGRSKHWLGTAVPKLKPRYSDEELEKIVEIAGGNVEEYRALRKDMAPSGFQSLSFRRRVVGEAAALTLSVEVKDVWGVLYKGWVKLQFVEKLKRELIQRNKAKKKRAKSR